MNTDIAQNRGIFKLRNNRVLDLSQKPQVMGILNVTPDSFSDGGKFGDFDRAIKQARTMINDGADIIDIGGESSRPGSDPVDASTELERVIPIIKEIRKFSDIPISIDTTKSEVAVDAIESGADIINDISALRFDNKMIETAVEYNTPVILMHMLGEPKTMQKGPHYDDCINEIKQFFRERIDYCLQNGLDKSNIIIDPGIGFGKRLEDNLNILKNLSEFNSLGVPILLGASRKSFISMITGNDRSADTRMGGSLATIFYAVRSGCEIVRVHDVAETVETIKVINAIESIQ